MIEKINPSVPTVFDYSATFRSEEHIQPFQFFHHLNGETPSVTIFRDIDKQKLVDNLKQLYGLTRERMILVNRQYADKSFKIDSGLLILQKDIFLYFPSFIQVGDHQAELLFGCNADEVLLKDLSSVIQNSIKVPEKQRHINLICKSYDGFELKDFPINAAPLDINLHYNDDFLEINEIIEKNLNSTVKKGLVLLHGIPGTGKTTYLRHIIAENSERMIYLPPDMTHVLASPDFLSFLTETPNSVLLIEDAENALLDRSQSQSTGAISNLLNLCDGLLSDCLNIMVICTFNCHISKIDQALLRKGRLIGKYKFDKLSIKKAQALCDHLQKDHCVTEPMTLAEIYNLEVKDYGTVERKVIGFH